MNITPHRFTIAAAVMVGALVAGCANKPAEAPITLKIGETTFAQVEAYFGTAIVQKSMANGQVLKTCLYDESALDENVAPVGKDALKIAISTGPNLEIGSRRRKVSLQLTFLDDKLSRIGCVVFGPDGTARSGSTVYSIPQ